MLSIVASLLGIFAVLVIAETLWRADILKGEYQRKFVHITSASFVAFWPWLMDWRSIQIIGLIMLVVVVANRFDHLLHFSADLRKESYGGITLALVISVAAWMTHVKLFFALAILHTSLADGLAAVMGTRYGKRWEYHVFGQLKTVIGTMTFWLTSLIILGIGLLFAYSDISANDYVMLLIFLPPALAALENLAVFGLDNIAVPIAVLAILKLVS